MNRLVGESASKTIIAGQVTLMSKPYLEVTYRDGKPFAAYLYLRRTPNEKAATTKRDGDLVVDYAADGHPIGIEFTRIGSVDLGAVNRGFGECARGVAFADGFGAADCGVKYKFAGLPGPGA